MMFRADRSFISTECGMGAERMQPHTNRCITDNMTEMPPYFETNRRSGVSLHFEICILECREPNLHCVSRKQWHNMEKLEKESKAR